MSCWTHTYPQISDTGVHRMNCDQSLGMMIEIRNIRPLTDQDIVSRCFPALITPLEIFASGTDRQYVVASRTIRRWSELVSGPSELLGARGQYTTTKIDPDDIQIWTVRFFVLIFLLFILLI